MQQSGDAQAPVQVETLVVHCDQLVPETMQKLAEAGYRTVSDPKLLIFARTVPSPGPAAQELGVHHGRANGDEHDEEVLRAQRDISGPDLVASNRTGQRARFSGRKG